MDEITPAVQIVGRYVDGLEVSIDGEPRLDIFEELRAEKGALRASPRGWKMFGSILGVPGGEFVLTTKGGAPFQFILYNRAVSHLEVTRRGALPKVMIQFRAKALYEHSFEAMNDIVRAIAHHFLEPNFRVKVSTVHVALDVQYENWVWPEMEDVDSYAKKCDVYYESRAVTAMTFGKRRSPLQIAIYDKRREVDVHDKREWMEGVRATSGAYNQELPVIRFELRFSRELLKDFGIQTVIDLRNHVGDVVRHAVGGQKPWFRVTSSGRPETAPWWADIRNAFLQDLPQTGQVRQRSVSPGRDLKRIRSTLVTNALQSAAYDKAQGVNPDPYPEQYLGSRSIHYLPGWPKANAVEDLRQAVDSIAKELVSSGKVL